VKDLENTKLCTKIHCYIRDISVEPVQCSTKSKSPKCNHHRELRAAYLTVMGGFGSSTDPLDSGSRLIKYWLNDCKTITKYMKEAAENPGGQSPFEGFESDFFCLPFGELIVGEAGALRGVACAIIF